MSTVITDNLTGKTSAGNVTITSEGGSATMQLQQGVAKHFINFDASSGTPTSQDSFNVSSITDSATGKFGINVTNNYSNVTYSLAGYACGVNSDTFSSDLSLGLGTNLIITTTSGVYEILSYATSAYRDSKHCDTQGFGDLA
jgi:hypothetical protein